MKQDKAIVVFTNSTYRSLQMLKPLFQHVCVVIVIRDQYVMIDPKGVGIHVYPVSSTAVDAALYSDKCVVTKCSITRSNKRYPPSVFSCVSVVKRILGVHAWWVQTPYQLYKYINKHNGDKHGLSTEDKEQYGQDTH